VVGKKKARKCLGIIAKSERAENVSEERIKVLVREELESKLHCAWWGGVGWRRERTMRLLSDDSWL
jgi:hypothetical protein